MMSSHYLSAALHCPSQLSADLLSSYTHFTPTDTRSYDSLDKILPFSSVLLKPSKIYPCRLSLFSLEQRMSEH